LKNCENTQSKDGRSSRTSKIPRYPGDDVERFLIQLAHEDARVTAAAVVGSRAHTAGDQWSDIDLTFAVATTPVAILDEWADELRAQFDGTALFDLTSGSSIYRVFLLPGALQVDLSVTPASQFTCVLSVNSRLFAAEGTAKSRLFAELRRRVPRPRVRPLP
jgi:hypothetical protein